MKRNLVPFLGIAFVVAIAATGVFYGLFVGRINGAAPPVPKDMPSVVVAAKAIERGMVLTPADLRVASAADGRPAGSFAIMDDVVGRTVSKALTENEPVTVNNVAGPRSEALLQIPKGMRAISVRVSDSAGLLPYLRPGHHVDVQAIQSSNGEMVARTLLSNVKVLSMHPETSQQTGPSIVNLLVSLRDVERVALADSAAKVRIVLRSPEETAESPATAPAARMASSAARMPGPRVSFQVRLAAAEASTVRDIASRAGVLSDDGAFRIGVLPAEWKADAALPQLERAHSLRMLSSENLDTEQGQEVSLQAAGLAERDYDLRLRLTPRAMDNGVVKLRVRPELTFPEGGGLSSRRFSADLSVADGQSIVVAGFERGASVPTLVEKFFNTPGSQKGGELLVVVTSRMAAASR